MIIHPVAILCFFLGTSSTPADIPPLLRGVDSPPPLQASQLSSGERGALSAVVVDVAAPVFVRARALRLLADAAALNDAAVEGLLIRLAQDAARELRVQAAWARVGRAARAGTLISLARLLAADPDVAVREVGALALWRDGSPAARRVLAERLAVERDPALVTLLRVRLSRGPKKPSSSRPASADVPAVPDARRP